jgi:hypothetical protein
MGKIESKILGIKNLNSKLIVSNFRGKNDGSVIVEVPVKKVTRAEKEES